MIANKNFTRFLKNQNEIFFLQTFFPKLQAFCGLISAEALRYSSWDPLIEYFMLLTCLNPVQAGCFC
jgi:hypothetical protein